MLEAKSVPTLWARQLSGLLCPQVPRSVRLGERKQDTLLLPVSTPPTSCAWPIRSKNEEGEEPSSSQHSASQPVEGFLHPEAPDRHSLPRQAWALTHTGTIQEANLKRLLPVHPSLVKRPKRGGGKSAPAFLIFPGACKAFRSAKALASCARGEATLGLSPPPSPGLGGRHNAAAFTNTCRSRLTCTGTHGPPPRAAH